MNKASVLVANWSGIGAIVLWSLLAVLPLMAGDLPPFLLLGLACSCACIMLLVVWMLRYGGIRKPLSYISRSYFLINAGFIFVSEMTLIVAMQAGHPVVAYLALDTWPIFTLLFASALLGQRLYWWHHLAAVLGMTGVFCLVIPGHEVNEVSGMVTLFALLFGLANAIVWSLYSVLNRRFQDVPADCIALPLVFCSTAALLLHTILESSYPLADINSEQWSAIVLLGTLPWGLSYVLWGHAMRFGNIRMLSLFGYIMPLLGVIWMLLFGYATLTTPVVIATILILASAILGSKSN